MRLARRKLLEFAAALPLALPVSRAGAGPSGRLRFLVVSDHHESPLLQPGDHVLVDTSAGTFQGEGVYLYPHWGQPRPYLVRELAGGVLAFLRLADGRELWTHAARPGARLFAGRAAGLLEGAERERIDLLHASHRPLRVPVLPRV